MVPRLDAAAGAALEACEAAGDDRATAGAAPVRDAGEAIVASPGETRAQQLLLCGQHIHGEVPGGEKAR